jgi:Mg-chelatase subunit ChlD
VGGGVQRRRGARRGRSGKSLTPTGGHNNAGRILEGADAREAVQEQQRQTISRHQLSRHEHFDEVSPEVGLLDEGAFDRALAEDPDDAMALLADLTAATDRDLAALARRLAGRLVLDIARGGRAGGRGVGKLVTMPADRAQGDLDVDASIDALQTAVATSTAPRLDELRLRAWKRPATAICLLVDRSGSMSGNRLVTACVTAAGCAWRAPNDYCVVAFADEAWVLKPIDAYRSAESVVQDVLRLRGHGVTDLSLGLRTAQRQLARTRAQRRITILLSDCRPTTGDDPAAAARALDELVIFAPDGDVDDATELAALTGGRCTGIAGPLDAPAALARLFDR